MSNEIRMTDERALADEYRPSMTLEVLHAWAAEAVARLRGEAAQYAPNYERMFHGAVGMLAEVSVALGIPDEVAEVANGNYEILAAIEKLKAQPEQQGQAVACIMQLARNWCLAWGEWARDADPGAEKENAAMVALQEALFRYVRPQPAGGDAVQAPPTGNWINADDVHRLVRELDVALNGEAGAAKQAMLVDVVGQAKRHARLHGPVFGQPEVYVDFPHSIGTAGPFPVRDGRITLTAETVADLLARQRVAAPAPVAGDAVAKLPEKWRRTAERLRELNTDIGNAEAASMCNDAKELEAALAQDRASQGAAPGVPEGWALVPKEPTLEMCRAVLEEMSFCSPVDNYRKMLAAAPKPTAGEVSTWINPNKSHHAPHGESGEGV